MAPSGAFDLDSFLASEASKQASRPTTERKPPSEMDTFFSQLASATSVPLPTTVPNPQALAGLEALGESLAAEKSKQTAASAAAAAPLSFSPMAESTAAATVPTAAFGSSGTSNPFDALVKQLPDLSFMMAKTLVVPASKYKLTV